MALVEMELWDLDAIDLLGPGFIELRGGDQGSFRLIAVEGWMDTAASPVTGVPGSRAGDRTSNILT